MAEQEQVDVQVERHGGVMVSGFTVQPLTPAANAWLDEHVTGEQSWFGGRLFVEPRYAADLVKGMVSDGLVVR